MGMFDNSDAENYLTTAQNNFTQIAAPTAAQLGVNNVPEESIQGTINPEMVNAVTEDPNQVSQVGINAQDAGEEQQAIAGEQAVANAGGLDANAQLGINEATTAANANLAGNLGSIMQNAQSQGNGNSGAVLAERLSAAQGSANNLQNQDLQAAAEAETNRENALANVGNLAGNMANTNLTASQTNSGALNNATAQNVATKNAANNTNVANNFNAQTTNLQNAQNVNAAQATAGQNMAYNNAQATQAAFNDQIAKASGQSGVATTQANLEQSNTNANDAMIGTGIGTVGTVVGGPAAGAAAKTAFSAQGGVAVPKLTLEQFMTRKKGLIPGKEKVAGNSLKNDNVPAMLSAGEVVIPKDVPKDTAHIKQFMRNAPIAGTNKKVNLEDFFAKKGGK